MLFFLPLDIIFTITSSVLATSQSSGKSAAMFFAPIITASFAIGFEVVEKESSTYLVQLLQLPLYIIEQWSLMKLSYTYRSISVQSDYCQGLILLVPLSYFYVIVMKQSPFTTLWTHSFGLGREDLMVSWCLDSVWCPGSCAPCYYDMLTNI